MRKVILASLVVATMSMSSAFAGGYKSAGCGLGSMIFTDDGILQIFAGTTNEITYSQLFGITSGTSNCGGSGGVARLDVEQERFVSSNYDTLSQEMAQGSGEHLNALATLMGCEKSSVQSFNTMAHGNYKAIVTGKSDEMLKAVKAHVSADPVLSKSCGAV